MLRFGPDDGPVVVMALPLFEEANRVRAFAASICRALAERGVASALPDVPGQGESQVPLETMASSGSIAEGYEAAVDTLRERERGVYGAAIRSGALLDYLADLNGRWHFAPQCGPDLLRELTRIKQRSADTSAPLHKFWYQEPLASEGEAQPAAEVAGNLIAASLFTCLKADLIWSVDDDGPWRVVRLDSDAAPADRHVPGAPLWRRAEPGNDLMLAQTLADDIAQWVRTCEGC